MSSPILRLLFCFALLVGVAGCGENSGTAFSGSPTIVTYTFNGNNIPVTVATQIGGGGYTQATLTSNKLILAIPNGETKYSVAYLCPSSTYGLVRVNEYIIEANLLDGTAFSETCSQFPLLGGTAAAEIDASAIPGAEEINVGFGSGCSACDTFSGSAFLTVGTYDVPVTVDGNGGPYSPPLAAKILRDQTIPGTFNGGAPVVFQTTDETVLQTITYNNVPSGYSSVGRTVVYNTAGGAVVQLEVNNSGAQFAQYVAMPSGTYQNGDYYDFLVQASDTTSGGTVSVESYTSSAGPQSFTFPPPWSYAGPTAAALPTFNFAYSGFLGVSNISYRAAMYWDLGGRSADFEILMSTTANYQNGLTAMSIPNLSSLTGFLATPPSGTTVRWSAGVLSRRSFPHQSTQRNHSGGVSLWLLYRAIDGLLSQARLWNG